MKSQKPSVFLDAEEGIQRVKNDNGGFAYFMESSTIEYAVERDCELSQVGGLLDNKGYGIALPPGTSRNRGDGVTWPLTVSPGICRIGEV